MGYGAFPLALIEYLWRAKQPYNVSVAAELAACAALTNPTYLEVINDGRFSNCWSSATDLDVVYFFHLLCCQWQRISISTIELGVSTVVNGCRFYEVHIVQFFPSLLMPE